MTMTPAGPRLLRPGLLPREPGLETYWVRPGGVTALRLDGGDELTVVDRPGRQAAELTVLGPGLGAPPAAPATVLRSLTGGGDGRAAVLGLLNEHGVSPASATATRLFGSPSNMTSA